MGQRRGSATINKASLWIAVLCFLIQSQINEAAVYTVGDGNNWSFGTDSWPAGKNFRSGDTLIFYYNPAFHNIVAVDASGYNNCQAPNGARVYNSGSDRLTLNRGTNYFICSIAGHCQGGMRIAVTAH